MHSNKKGDEKVDRRSFLQTAGVVAGSAFASSALSYSRIAGANDRIALGHIGIGNRGSQLQMMAARLKGQYSVETVAVCDLWKNNRERRGRIRTSDTARSALLPARPGTRSIRPFATVVH
jgi:hypothetical protein